MGQLSRSLTHLWRVREGLGPRPVSVLAGLVALIALALTSGGVSSSPADGEGEPDPQVVAAVEGYAQETGKGYEHVLRWMRVLKTFGVLDGMSAAEARDYAEQHLALRWAPVADELWKLENGQDEPSRQLVAAVRGYAQETKNGYDHVLRWMRVLESFGVVEEMTAAEAQGYADRGWSRWVPVAAELAELEGAPAESGEFSVSISASPTYPKPGEVVRLRAVIANPPAGSTPSYQWRLDLGGGQGIPMGRAATTSYAAGNPGATSFLLTVSYPGGESATSSLTVEWAETPPNRAPVVNRWAEWQFAGKFNAPRGYLITRTFTGMFSDPDGDDLTYSVSVPDDQRSLVESLDVHLGITGSNGEPVDFVSIMVETESDWKAISPALPDPLTFTATLTATDPGGVSTSVSTDFFTDWESHPELVSAVAGRQVMELSFEQELQANPSPAADQFTVNVTNEDDSTATIAVSSVSIDGKVLTLELASALTEGQTVSLDYAHDAETPLTRAGGGDGAPSFEDQAVELDLGLPPVDFEANLVLGTMNLLATWDEAAGATSYKLRWRLSGSEFDAADALTVSRDTAVITVTDFGQWEVRLQACNDDGCGPETSQTVDLARNLNLNLAPARDADGSVRPQTVTATWDPVPDASSYTLIWRPIGTSPSAQDQPGSARRSRSASGDGDQGASQVTVSGDQTSAEFTVPGDGEYRAELQANDDRRVIAQDDAEVNQAPDQTDTTPPRIVRGEINGSIMTIYFSEPLDQSATGGRFYAAVELGGLFYWTSAYSSNIQISGNKVTVDFGTSLRARGGLWASAAYVTNPADSTANNLRDVAGNVVRTPNNWPGGWRGTGCLSLVNLTGAPSFESGTAHLHWLALTFDATLDKRSVPAGSAFTVEVNGSEVGLNDIEPVLVAENTVTVVLASPVGVTDDVTVSYAKPLDRRLRGTGGPVESFSGDLAKNTADTTPPRLMRGEVDGDTMTLYFSEALDEDSMGGRFKVSLSGGRKGGGVTFTATGAVEFSGNMLSVGFGGTYRSNPGEWALVVYRPPEDSTADSYQDLAGNALLASGFVELPNLTGVPSFQGATAHAHWVTLTFDGTLSSNSVPTGSSFTVEVNGSAVSLAEVDPVIVSGNTVTLVLDSPLTSTDSATVRYVRQAGSRLWSAYGAVKSFPDQSVTNMVGAKPEVSEVSISSIPFADGAYGLGQTIHVTLEFTEAVDVIGTPRLKIKMDPDWGEFWANYDSGTGTNTLTFAYQVAEPNTAPRGIAVLRGGLELNGGAIRSAATATTDAHLWYGGLDHDPDHRVNWRRPGPQGPWVIGESITSSAAADNTYAVGETVRVTLEFSEAVDVTGTPRLKIRLGSGFGERWADYESGTGTNALVFAYTVAQPDRSTLGVAVPENTLELNGGAIRSAAATPKDAHLEHEGLDHDLNQQVDWRRSSPGIPWVTGVAITSNPGDDDIYRLGETIQVTVTFSEAMDVDDTGGKPRLLINLDPNLFWNRGNAANNRWADYVGDSGTTALTFAYTVVEAERSLRGILVGGNTLELNGGTIRSAAATPTDASLRHERLDHDWDHRVDGLTPSRLSVIVHETTVAISYDEALDADSVPPAGAFTVQRTPQGGTQETVSLSGPPKIAGGAVILTLADPILATDTAVKVSYSKPTAVANRVKDKAGNEAEGFSGQAVDATDTTKPRLVRGEVNDRTMFLYFSEALDEDSVGGYYRFTLWGHAQDFQITITASGAVEISGNRVSVGLGGGLRSSPGGNLMMDYRKSNNPAVDRLRDLAGNELFTPENFGGRASTGFFDLDNFTVPP